MAGAWAFCGFCTYARGLRSRRWLGRVRINVWSSHDIRAPTAFLNITLRLEHIITHQSIQLSSLLICSSYTTILVLNNPYSIKDLPNQSQHAVLLRLCCCCRRCHHRCLIRTHKRHSHLCALPYRHRSSLSHGCHAYLVDSPLYWRRLAHGRLCSRSCHRWRYCPGKLTPWVLTFVTPANVIADALNTMKHPSWLRPCF